MSMANNVVAYAGVDNFDNILYLSRILIKLDKRVLIVDHSERGSLIHSIPKPKGVNADKTIISYRQMDFTTMMIPRDLLADYDDVFIYYGFNKPLKDLIICNRMVWVTDLYRYHYEDSEYFPYYEDAIGNSMRYLLVKDAVELKITPEMIAERMELCCPVQNISILYIDERDYYNSLICHYNGDYRFTDISKQRRKYLLKEIKSLYPQLKDKHYKVAYRKARKGD